ncbi:MAG: 2-oxo acid dehydrogenase subunit E2 [Clostridia bacterium]|nr:2-oxo acid dehydrogenase subunit E2 [Clostridia bacterium]MDD4386661.1 2-oxo acid dehydrogenase subunit E2 [Clostridia bacterium]
MFGKRSDGKIIKGVDIFFKLIPYIMNKRSDSQVFFRKDVELNTLDEYIDKKKSEGIRITHMDIIYSALVRLIAERSSLNRFVINSRIYSRKHIYISLVVKKSMNDAAEETVVKLKFTGNENIFEIKDKLENCILENRNTQHVNSTDKLAGMFKFIPNWILKLIVGFLKYMDKHGIMPKSIIEASPFHTSVFLTNVGSIGLDYIYHHLYNFGTNSLFISMGKKKKRHIYKEDEISEDNCISLGIVADERICDGFYFGSSLKTFTKYLKNPELLEENFIKKEDIK